jgi:hypothetical protein
MSLYELQGLGSNPDNQVNHSGWSTGGCQYQSHIDGTCNSGWSTGGCRPTR